MKNLTDLRKSVETGVDPQFIEVYSFRASSEYPAALKQN